MENSLKGLCYKLFKVNFEELHFVNLELVIIDYLSKQEHGVALIMGIDCVIYAQMQR
jgi:phosphoglucomutase